MIINNKSYNYRYGNINHSRIFAEVQWSICILRNYNFEATDGILLPEAVIFRCSWCHSILDVTLEPFATEGHHSLLSGHRALKNTDIFMQYVNSTLLFSRKALTKIHFIGCFYLDSHSLVQPIWIYLLNGKVFPDLKSYYDMGLNFPRKEQ